MVGNGQLCRRGKHIANCSVSGMHRAIRCAPGSPVHMQTGKTDCFPNEKPTAPRLLGVIKGTPRRME
jgi:hypothetical protein